MADPQEYDPLRSKGALNSFIQRARAAGKTDDEIRAFVQAKREAAGMGGSEYSMPNVASTTGTPEFEQPAAPHETGFTQVAPGRVQYMAGATGLPSEETMKQDVYNALKMAGGAALTIGGAELGGGLVPSTLVKARPLLGMALKAGARAVGAGAGSEAGAALQGEKPSLSRGLETARNVAAVEGIVRLPAYMAARTGGVEPAAAALAQDRPELLNKAPASEYAKAVKDIAETKIPLTPEHAAYQTLVEQRGKVDGLAYAQKIFDKVRKGVDEPTARLIERKTDSLANSLLDRLDNNGQISARDLDEWLRTNVSEPASVVYEKGAGSLWQKRLADLRDDLVPKLYDDVSGAPVAERRALGAARPVITPEEAARQRAETELLRRAPGATDAENAIRAGQKGEAFKTPPTPEELAKARGLPQMVRSGPSAAELQRSTNVKLSKVEAAKSMFPPPTPTRMNLQSPSYLRQVLKDTDLGHEVRTRLAGLDEVAGTHHLARVEDLAMRSSWTAAEKAEVEDILANVPAIAYERVGLVRAGARKAGRVLTRIIRPAGRVAAVASTIRGVSQ